MQDNLIYSERVSSVRTEILFISLTVLFLLLLIWRIAIGGFDFLAGVFLVIFVLFLFYALNYQTLIIHLTPAVLKLSFGVFRWTIPLENIESCSLDDIPVVMKFGGAGIHFMVIGKRYRASFNFLEHPRVVIRFKRKVGWVWDISFSTRRPAEVIDHIRRARTARDARLENREDGGIGSGV